MVEDEEEFCTWMIELIRRVERGEMIPASDVVWDRRKLNVLFRDIYSIM